MFYKIILAVIFVFLGTKAFATGQEECGPAVEEADKLAAGTDSNCDYTQKGLNGVIHRALSSKDKSGQAGDQKIKDVKTNTPSSDNLKAPVERNQTALEGLGYPERGEFKSAEQLPQVKFALLEKVALECTKGFVIEGERYLATRSAGTLKLELIYHCL